LAIPVANPQNGDDLTAQSITVNVTDKIVAWAGSHETGQTTNFAARHATSNIDDSALPETTPLSAASVSGELSGGQHARNDMFASAFSSVAGANGGSGFVARIGALAGMTYGDLTKVNAELTAAANVTASPNRLVRRDSTGGAAFIGTVNVAALVGTGNFATTGSVSGASFAATGVIIAGSGSRQITTADGHLDATQLSGPVSTTSMPTLSGDVSNVAGVVTVNSIGGKTAAQVATSVNATLAASSTAVGHHSALAAFDSSGGMTFDGTVTGTTFVGALLGSATGVPATGISGTVAASQIDVAIARTANVPTNAGVGATGTWPISISGSAVSVVASGVTTTAIADGAVTGTKIAARTITTANIADGSVVAQTVPNMTAQVQPYSYYNSGNIYGTVSGTTPTYPTLPGAGNSRYDLLYTDDSFALGWLTGTAGASPAKPTLPVGSLAKPLAWVGPVNNTTTAITQGMISDARPSLTSGSSTGGGGGTSGLPVATPIVTIGADPTATGETDLFALAGGSYISDGGAAVRNGVALNTFFTATHLIKTDNPATAAYATGLDNWIAADFEHRPQAYLYASGSTLNLIPMTMQINGTLKRSFGALVGGLPPTLVFTATQTAGIWYIWADYTGRTDGTFILNGSTIFPSTGLTGTQRLLCVARHNGTAFIGDPDIDWSPILQVTSTQMRPLKSHKEGYPTSLNVVTATSPTHITFFDGVIDIPKNMDLRISGYMYFTGASGTTGLVYLQVDSTIVGVATPVGFGMTGAWQMATPIGGALDGLSTGPHNVQIFAQLISGTTMTCYAGQWEAIEWCP
jgi:hypothetical protein